MLWDGSIVDEVSAADHVARFTTVSNPTTIEVTFTLQNVEFKQSASDKKNEALKMTAVTDKKIVLDNIGDTAELAVKIIPRNTDSLVTFTSDNANIVSVDNTALATDPETGEVRITVTAMNEGKATVTAMT